MQQARAPRSGLGNHSACVDTGDVQDMSLARDRVQFAHAMRHESARQAYLALPL